MAQRVDIDAEDLKRLVEALRYAITKTGGSVLSDYLDAELTEVLEHIENEHRGADIAQEIDAVLAFIGDDDDG